MKSNLGLDSGTKDKDHESAKELTGALSVAARDRGIHALVRDKVDIRKLLAPVVADLSPCIWFLIRQGPVGVMEPSLLFRRDGGGGQDGLDLVISRMHIARTAPPESRRGE